MAVPRGVDILVLNKHVINTLRKDLQDLAHDLNNGTNLKQAFERIRDEVNIPSIEKNFEVGGRPRWEPLSPSTTGLGKAAFIESAASGNIGGRKPLTKTGQMRRAATAKARFRIRRNEMHYGQWPSKRWFGPVHNLPDLSKKAQVPNRPFTLIYPEDKVAAGEIMLDWVEDRVDDNIRLRYA